MKKKMGFTTFVTPSLFKHCFDFAEIFACAIVIVMCNCNRGSILCGVRSFLYFLDVFSNLKRRFQEIFATVFNESSPGVLV